jgi:hypothetical protein
VQSLQRQVSALARQQASTEESTGTVVVGGGALSAERRSNLAAAETELGSLEQRQRTLEQLAGQAEERGNRFSDIESQAASLLAQVNVKGALVSSLTQRAGSIDDQLHDVPTGFRHVSDAIPPEMAVPSKKKKIIALATPLAFGLFALLLVIARDLNGLRLIAPEEVAWWGNGPVVATSRWPRDSESLDDLLADLEELLRDKRGEMLLIGASDVERALAETLTLTMRGTWRGVQQDEPEAILLPARSSSATDPQRRIIANVLPMGRRARGSGSESGSTTSSSPGFVPALSPGVSEVLGASGVSGDDTGGVRVSQALRVSTHAWEGPRGIAGLRRAARRSDGVLVLVGAGVKAGQLVRLRRDLAREDGIAFALLAVSDAVARQNDRAGDVDGFLSGFAG